MKVTSRTMLAGACVLTVVVAAALRLLASGWVMILGIWVYPIVLIGHCATHYYCIAGRGPSRRLGWALLASNAILLTSFLLHYDTGDDYGWLTITRWFRVLSGGRVGSERIDFGIGDFGHLTYDALLLVPVFVSWGFAIREAKRATAGPAASCCAQCGYPIGTSPHCSECGCPTTPTAG